MRDPGTSDAVERHVISLRTDAEMADRREVPYDEPATLASRDRRCGC